MASAPGLPRTRTPQADCSADQDLARARPDHRNAGGRPPQLKPARVGAVTGLLSVVPSVNLLNSAFRHRTSRHVPATYTEWRYTVFYSLTKMNDPVYEKEQAQFGGAIHRNVPQVGNQCLRACSSRSSHHSGWDHKIARRALGRKFYPASRRVQAPSGSCLWRAK